MENLERIVANEGDNSPESNLSNGSYDESRGLYQKFKDTATNYLVDVSAGLMFYNPVMATGEYLVAGMDGSEVMKSRLGASLMQAICMRPIGKLRNASAKLFGITKESPWYQKWASDVASTLVVQLPTYATALYFAGASLEEGATALGMGAAVTATSGRFFGKWMDTWRKTWGKEPAIK